MNYVIGSTPTLTFCALNASIYIHVLLDHYLPYENSTCVKSHSYT